MTLVEIYIKNELLWGGMMPAVPQIGSQLNVLQAPTFRMGDDGAQASSPPEVKIYQIVAAIYAVSEGYPIMQLSPRLQAVEIDVRTGRPKEPLVTAPNLIH